MDHFYPDNMAPKFELGYERLTIDELASSFFVFLCMSMLAIVGLFIEIIFDKITIQLNKNTNDIVMCVFEDYHIDFIVHLANDTTAHNIFRDKCEIFLNDFDVHDVYTNVIMTSDRKRSI
jgi:hypothetical protein